MDKVNEFEYGVDEMRIKTKYRFSKESNEHYRYGGEDITNDVDIVVNYVKHHITHQAPRLRSLKNYYEGMNETILELSRRKEPELADNRMTHNFAQYISTFIQGYMAGVPIKTEYPANDDDNVDEVEVNDMLQKINRINEADELNSELILDQSIYGRAYELVFRSQQDEVRFVRLDPEYTFMILSDDVEKRPVAGVRYVYDFGSREKLTIYLYTEDFIVSYRLDLSKESQVVETEVKENMFAEVPIVEYENNSSRRGDFESVLSLIDAYDSTQSDLANYSQDINDALLVIEGNPNIDSKKARDMKKVNIMILRPSTSSDGTIVRTTADYKYKKYDVSGMEAYKTRLLNDIFMISNVPNLLDSQFSGNQSGEALKMKLFGLSQKRATKERKFKKGLRKRYRLIKNILETAKEGSFEVENLVITFTENMPRAITQEIEWFSKLGGKLSQATMLSLLSFIENPQKEKDKLAEEAEVATPTNNLDYDNLRRFAEEGDANAELGAEQEERA